MKKKIQFFTLFLSLFLTSYGQDIPESILNKGIYEFLDEMASEKIISINSACKPYSKMFIAEKLLQISNQQKLLNKRQSKELAFYMQAYNLELNAPDSLYQYNILKNKQLHASFKPFGIFYADSLFQFVLRPVWGIKYYSTIDSNMYHQWGGAEMSGYVGKHVGFYVSLTDHTQNKPLSSSGVITQEQGATLKGEAANNYSEIRGGITYSWNWGSIGLIKDNPQWGEGYNGTNILSGRTQSVAMIKFNMKPSKWFEFNYVHARLASNIIDSSRSYIYDGSNTRLVMRPKYMAANLFTFTPFSSFNISIGNSIVYSDESFQLQYLIPFMFFKSVDDTYNATENNAGNNSQMFATVSSRNIKHLHLYASLFIDEMSVKRMFKSTQQSNFISIKAGARCSNFPIKNLSVTAEYTRNNPLVYQHFIPATTFASGSINMGNYLGDNADELFFSIAYAPLSRLSVNLSATIYRLGDRYVYGKDGPWGLPFMKNTVLTTQLISGKISYQALTNVYLIAEVIKFNNTGDDSYNPIYLRSSVNSKNLIINGTLALGF